MLFPLTVFADQDQEVDKKKFCDFFSSTGAGGWYTYKIASELKDGFTVCREMKKEMASQITFIFGTFKEDLSISSKITDVSIWYTREEMGTCFRQQRKSNCNTKIR